jgi:hypothetical protein
MPFFYRANVVEKLEDEQKKFEQISPEMKKIYSQQGLPKQLATLFATRQIYTIYYLLS